MMTLEEYLTERLGKEEATNVLDHAKRGDTIHFSGPPATGKTTMVTLLRRAGFRAMDEPETIYHVKVEKPLEEITPHGFIEANF